MTATYHLVNHLTRCYFWNCKIIFQRHNTCIHRRHLRSNFSFNTLPLAAHLSDFFDAILSIIFDARIKRNWGRIRRKGVSGKKLVNKNERIELSEKGHVLTVTDKRICKENAWLNSILYSSTSAITYFCLYFLFFFLIFFYAFISFSLFFRWFFEARS